MLQWAAFVRTNRSTSRAPRPLRAAFRERRTLAFRDQFVNPPAQIAFARFRDNQCTMHYAIHGHDCPERVPNRTTLHGDVSA